VGYARRRHGVRLRAVAGAAATLPLLWAVVAGLGIAVWWVLGELRPAYQSLVWGATYRPQWYEAGLSVLAVTVTLVWYRALRKRADTVEVALAVWAWLLLFAVPLALFVPGAAYLFTWPVLVGGAALALALRLGGADRSWRAIGSSGAAFPAAALWLPDFSQGLGWAAAPMTFIALLAATALPLTDLVLPRRVLLVPAVGAFAAVALITVGLRVDVFDPDHPRQTSLNYALDADRGAAMWLSADRRPPGWTRRYVTGETDDVAERFPGPLTRARHSGPAPVAAVPPPTVTVIENRSTGATRVLRLRISSGGGRRLDVVADTAGHHVAATVEGHAVHAAPPRPRAGRWDWAFTFEAVPAAGIDVTLTVRGEGPLPLRLLSYHDGLPPVPRLTPPPEDLTWGPYLSNATVVAKSYRL
jgi:hypothetical protein